MKISKKVIFTALLFVAVFALPGLTVKESEKRRQEEVRQEEENRTAEIEADTTDTDLDGLYDYEEKKLSTNAAKKDTDMDGLGDYEEARKWFTDPNNANTDGDQYEDGEEVERGYDPQRANAQLDTDGDGLGNAEEIRLGTDPEAIDTDGDGFSDKEETDNRKRDPLDSTK